MSTTRIEASCMMRGEALSEPASISLELQFQDGTRAYDFAHFSPNGTFGWTQVSVTAPPIKPLR